MSELSQLRRGRRKAVPTWEIHAGLSGLKLLDALPYLGLVPPLLTLMEAACLPIMGWKGTGGVTCPWLLVGAVGFRMQESPAPLNTWETLAGKG